jgi:hypothetical protein
LEITDFYYDYIDRPGFKYTFIDGNLYGIQATKVTLDFKGAQSIYGFSTRTIEKTAVKETFYGSNKISINNLPSNLKILLKNMQLESYDNYSGEREDILMSVPAINFAGNRLVYEASNPVFIDINNSNEMNLTQIYIELKDFKGKYIPILKEECDLTLLIRDSKEA